MITLAVIEYRRSMTSGCVSTSKRPSPWHVMVIAACMNGGILIWRDPQQSRISLLLHRDTHHSILRRVSILRLGLRCLRVMSLRFAKTTVSILVWVPRNHLALTREHASNAVIDEICAWKHIHSEILDEFKPSCYTVITSSYKHRYDTLHMYCLFPFRS